VTDKKEKPDYRQVSLGKGVSCKPRAGAERFMKQTSTGGHQVAGIREKTALNQKKRGVLNGGGAVRISKLSGG